MATQGQRGELVADLLARFWGSDWTIMDLFAEDAILEDPLLPVPIRGKEALLNTFKFCHSWADLRPELRSAFGADTFAAAEFVVRGVVNAALEGYSERVVGASFEFAEADVFAFDSDGRISRMSIYADVAGFDRQLREFAERGEQATREEGDL